MHITGSKVTEYAYCNEKSDMRHCITWYPRTGISCSGIVSTTNQLNFAANFRLRIDAELFLL